METIKLAIAGGGQKCLEILDYLTCNKHLFPQVIIAAIAGPDLDPSILDIARRFNILTTGSYEGLLEIKDLDLIVAPAGDKEVAPLLNERKPANLQIITHKNADLLLTLLKTACTREQSGDKKGDGTVEKRGNNTAIFNTLSDSILFIGGKNKIESVNRSFLKNFGLSRNDVIGRPCYEVLFNRHNPCADTFCPLGNLPSSDNKEEVREYLFKKGASSSYYEAIYRPIPARDNEGPLTLLTLRDITDRKNLEITLENSQKKYKDLFDNATEGLALFDLDGVVLECNLSLAYMLGYSKFELERLKICDVTKGYSKNIFAYHLEGLKILGFISVDMDFETKNGKTLPVEANISWLEEEKLFRIMVRDISIEKKLEDARKQYSAKLEKEVRERTLRLKQSEEYSLSQKKTAEGIIYGSPIPMFVLDETHKITHWNKACEKLTRFTSKEMIGTSRQWEPFFPRKRPLLADLVIENDLNSIKRLYKDMKLRKSPLVDGAYEAENFFPYLGNAGTHLYMNAAPIKNDDGEIKGAIVTYQDFSERVAMTLDIKKREAFVQNLILNSIDGIIATDEGGKINIFNSGAAEILGYSSQEVIDKKTYDDILSIEAVSQIKEAFSGGTHGPPGKIINMEIELPSKFHNPVPVRISGTLLSEESKDVGSVLFMQDLSEVHRLQRQKENSERMAAIGRTVSGLAHYIKNILSGLKGGAYVINSAISKRDIELIKDGWGMVERNIDQIGSIVTDMLIYSKQGRPQYKLDLIDPNELAIEVMELIYRKSKISGVKILRELEEGLKKVAMDRRAIHRCLLNLMSNAVDACTLEGIVSGSGIVKIKTDSPPGWGVRFQVVDNGTGMDEKTRKRLFSDFFTTKGYKGTGLGLPVTDKIVRDHGGKLSFESKAGQGTNFMLFLPEHPPIS